MANRDFEISMKLKADFKSAQQALGETQDGIEAVSQAAERANATLDKSTNAQSNRLREMVQRSLAELEAARAQVDTAASGTSAGTGGSTTAQASAVRDLTAAQQAQAQAMRASQQAVAAEIGLIGELQDRLSRGATSMDDLADTEARLDTAMAKGLVTAEEYDDALAKLNKEQARLDTAATKADKTLATTVGRYDKASAGLARLQRDEAALKVAVDQGRVSREQYNRAMAAISDERTRLTALRQGAEQSASAMRKLSLNTAESQRNMAQLVAYSASGQWQLAGSQILQLGNSAGAAGALFTSTGLAIGGVVAVLGGFAAAAAAGYLQMRALENALVATGGAAGVTAGQLGDMRDSIGEATGEYGDAQAAIVAFINSGQIATDSLDEASRAAVNLSTLTGESIEQTTAKIIGLAKSPTAALVELNDRYHFLTEEVYTHIRSLEDQGRAQDALKLGLAQLDAEMATRVKTMREQAGTLERAWDAVGRAVADAIQTAKDFGRTDLEGQLANAERALQNLSSPASLARGLSTPLQVEQQQKLVNSLRAQVKASQEVAKAEGERRAETDRAIADQQKLQDDATKARKDLDSQLAQSDKRIARQQQLNALTAQYNAIAAADPNDKRLYDGSQEKLRAAIIKATEERTKAARSSGGRSGTDPDQAAQRELDNLQKQVALLGDLQEGETKASEASRIRYEIEQGAYAKAGPAIKQQLVDQAQLLDSERALREEQKKKQEAFDKTKQSYAQLLDTLRTPAEVALDNAIAQVKTLNDAIKAGIALPADYTESIARIGQGAIGDTPKFDGLAPEVGGAYSELARIEQARKDLEAWNQERLDLIAKGRADENANQQVWDAAELERAKKHQEAMSQIEAASQSARLTFASDFFGQLAQLQNSENSKAARIGKTAAIAQALINTYKSATEAYAAMAGIPYVGPALGVAAAAAAVAAGMAQVSAIRSVSTGYATGGHVRGPGTGTSDSINAWLSDYEFVTRAAVVRQPGALGFLEDFNERGMPALYDWTGQARFAEGGLATQSSLTAPDWADMQRRQEAATQPANVTFNHRGVTVFDIDDVARRLGESREFESVSVEMAINNGKKIRGGWGS